MKKNIKKIAFIGGVLFLLMQLYQPARNTDSGQILPTHITEVYTVPLEVQNILKISCYDCHSNNTRYPWYSYLQPSRSLMEWDIKEGKDNLNFSEFGDYSKRKQKNKLKSIVKQVEQEEMPLFIYTLIHRDAILTSTQKSAIINWINTISHE